MASQPTAFRFQAFLCYSHRDSAWADWLHRALESYPIPSRLVGLHTSTGVIPPRLAPVFRDRDELPSATDLSAKVSDALAQSANLIVICSPHAAQSHWVNQEVETFQRLGRADRIFCLIVDGEPGASAWTGREHEECLPPALTHRFNADGKDAGERLEPIAADARPGKDGKSNARTKLVAGLLGVDLDDLRHRERRRRRWNMTAGVAIGFVLFCLTTALAVNAVLARHAAERRQKQAEDLVGFMLGDLDDKLRQVNRLDILESVADKVVRYFAALPPADITAGALVQSTQARLKLGAVQRDQGRIDQAVESFKAALAASQDLLHHEPRNSEYQKLEAESLSWLGVVDWSQGRLEDALSRFTAARDTLVDVSTRGPEDSSLIDRIGSARTNVGRIFEARGQTEEARKEYTKVLEAYAHLSRRAPDELEWRRELGYAHNNLAQLALKDGTLEEAINEYIADRDIKVQLFELDPTNNARREDLVASEAFLGRLLHLCGESTAAAAHLGAAMDGIEVLLEIDSNSTDWLEKAGNYGWMLGEVSRTMGNRIDAERRDGTAIARLRQLVDKDPSNVVWQRKLALAYLENARRLMDLGQTVAARDAATAADSAVAHALERAGEDLANQLTAAQLRVVQGDVAAAEADTVDARVNWQRALDILGDNARSSRDPAVKAIWLDASLRLGLDDSVLAAANGLVVTGYRDPDFVATLKRHGIAVVDASATSRIRDRVRRLGGVNVTPE